MSRTDVRKTYKLYIGGAFPRSESGRTYVVSDASGRLLANAAKASRKDARDAVVAARKAFGGWSGRTAYNRGQVVYRVAEVLESRRAQFEAELAAGGSSGAEARADGGTDVFIDHAKMGTAGVGERVLVVVLDDARRPVRASVLADDIEIGRGFRARRVSRA